MAFALKDKGLSVLLLSRSIEQLAVLEIVSPFKFAWSLARSSEFDPLQHEAYELYYSDKVVSYQQLPFKGDVLTDEISKGNFSGELMEEFHKVPAFVSAGLLAFAVHDKDTFDQAFEG